MPTNSLIEAHRLSKTYKHTAVVTDVSFRLQPGEILALLGPNGAGKTTTLKMILGLVTPTSGLARVAGRNTAVLSEARKALQAVGAVLEGSRNTYWPISIRENLRYFGGLRGLPPQLIDKRATPLLATLGLTNHQHKPVGKLSRGMQQKVALAVALIHEPQILILDEPTLGLDLESARQMEESVKELAQQGKGVLLTTHTMNLAEKVANTILVMNQGRVVAYDEMTTLLQQFNSKKVVEITLAGTLQNGLTNQIQTQFPTIVIDTHKNTVLTWIEPDQKQVLHLLSLSDAAGYEVLSVIQRESNLEELFLSLTQNKS